jgi:hypothetical protein
MAGRWSSPGGDSFFAVFASAVSAVEAAGACQLGLGPRTGRRGRRRGADGAAHRRGACARRRLCRPRADQPVRPGEGRRARRPGLGHQDHAQPGGGPAGRRVRPEETRGVPAARLGRARADLPAHRRRPPGRLPADPHARGVHQQPAGAGELVHRPRPRAGANRGRAEPGAGGDADRARPGWRCRPPGRPRPDLGTGRGCASWRRSATRPGWTTRSRRCSP